MRLSCPALSPRVQVLKPGNQFQGILYCIYFFLQFLANSYRVFSLSFTLTYYWPHALKQHDLTFFYSHKQG